MYYKAIHDVDYGFEGTTGTCRGHTFLVIIQIPNSLHGSVDKQESVQYIKSKSQVVLTKTESKYRYRPHQETDQKSWIDVQRPKPLRGGVVT